MIFQVCVLFYHSEDGDVEDILESMETLDDNMDAEEVEFVKCSDEEAVSYYGLTIIPSLVYFEVIFILELSYFGAFLFWSFLFFLIWEKHYQCELEQSQSQYYLLFNTILNFIKAEISN
jgi:hypothetical protein